MLNSSMSETIIVSIASLSRRRGWRLYAVATVSSHLHTVIGAPMMAVPLLDEVREESVRWLEDQRLCDGSKRFWSEGGHFSVIHTMRELDRVVEYVLRHRMPNRH